MTRNGFSIFVILCLFLPGFFVAENGLTTDWWQTATMEDVKARFDTYANFDHYDDNGRSLVMYALLYTNDPNIPLYFLKSKNSTPDVKDRNNRTATDYARANPMMRAPLAFLENERDANFFVRGADK